MAIDPEVIHSSSKAGRFTRKVFPKWAIYIALIALFFVMINLIKALVPWILLILAAGFILKKVSIR